MGYVMKLRKKVGHQPLIVVGAAAIVIKNNQLLLVHRTDNHLWGLPAGSKELHESLENTVLRELREETGLVGSNPKPLTILSGEGMFYEYPNGDQIDSTTAVYQVEATGTLRGSAETSESRFFDLKNLPEKMTPLSKRILTQLKL